MSSRSAAVLAITLALALLTAPWRAALEAGCDLCPPDCPMHRVAGAEHGAAHAARGVDEAPKMKCHNAVGARPDHDGDLPRIARPACGTHGARAGLALAPMVLPEAVGGRPLPQARRAPGGATRMPARKADPPDTPPPILHA